MLPTPAQTRDLERFRRSNLAAGVHAFIAEFVHAAEDELINNSANENARVELVKLRELASHLGAR